MNICFISGFSQPSSILNKLGENLNYECNKTYLSPADLAGSDNYVEVIHEKLVNKNDLVLVGWSLGGFLALEYATRYEVRALVVISGTANYLKNTDNEFGIEPAKMEALIHGVVNSKEQSLKRFISSVCSPAENNNENFEKCFQSAMAIKSSILVENLEYFKKDLINSCKNIKTPTLIIHDNQDRVVPVEQGYLLSSLIENSSKYITSGFGHLVILRGVQNITNRIEEFLRQVNE